MSARLCYFRIGKFTTHSKMVVVNFNCHVNEINNMAERPRSELEKRWSETTRIPTFLENQLYQVLQ